LEEHLIPARRNREPKHVIGMRQRVQQAAHPRRGDRQRPARHPRLQAEVQLALPGCQLLPPGGLQQFHLGRGMRRPQMLDIPRPAVPGVHDLHGRRA
jgi:hypothetical protein